MKLEDIIRYENEGTALDFKQRQYAKQKNADLLKDIMAMANADTVGERHIIVGVKYQPSGERVVIGIPDDEFIDDAEYQQLVKENIEPDVPFSYRPFSIDGYNVGVFTIGPQLNPPYLMRKDYLPLRRGEGWVRKGSHQCLLNRADYDRVYQMARAALGSKVRVGYGRELTPQTATPDLTLELPSYTAQAKITALIAQKQKEVQKKVSPYWANIDVINSRFARTPFDERTYESKSVKELREDLRGVSDAYFEDDLYELQEAAFRLDIWVLNDEDEYLRNCVLTLDIPKADDFLVIRELSSKPDPSGFKLRTPAYPESELYPSVDETAGSYIVERGIGDIVNHAVRVAYVAQPRLLVTPVAAGKSIDIVYRLHAENLSNPLTGSLRITFGTVTLFYAD